MRKKEMNSSEQLRNIIYEIDSLILDADNLCEFLEVLGIGFFNDHSDNKDMEVASIAIITEYIEKIQKKKLEIILEMLKKLNNK